MAEYKLYIGNSSSNFVTFTGTTGSESTSSDGNTANLVLNSLNGSECKFRASLEHLDFQKKMYEPCEIHAELMLTSSSKNSVSRQVIAECFSNQLVKLACSDIVVADNYRVFKVRSIHKLGSSLIKVKLDIFSLDKLLTLDKYSKAFTGKKLSGLFTSEIAKFKINDAFDVNLQLLSYEEKNGHKEFRHPYLVQYNESFYDFIRRVANRCGEFLYFEDGKLHLGITATDLGKDYADKAQELDYDSLYSNSAFNDNYGVSNYAFNYLNNKGSGSPLYVPNGTLDYYNDPLSADDYLGDIGENYTTYDKQLGMWDKNVMSVLFKALSGKSFSDIISSFAVSATMKALTTNAMVKTLNDANYQANIKGWKKMDKNEKMTDDPKEGTEDQWNNHKLRQFGTIDDQKSKISEANINLTSVFYSLVRQAEKKVGEEAVWMDFGSNFQNLKLGNIIAVNGTKYLVIQVTGSQEATDVRQQVVAIPLFSPSDSSSTPPIPIPQLLPYSPIRESQPQVAFIAQGGFMDPSKMGRVRVRFPWQGSEDDPTPWIRVSLPFATDGGGVKFKPEAGDEVLVSFRDGNVERPYVSGFLLSPRSNESWRALPDRGITSKNGHSITFNDGKDGGSFFYNLWPGLSMIKSFFPTTVWPNSLDSAEGCMAMAGSTVISDRYGLYKIVASSDTRSVVIQSAMGNVTLNAFTGITIAAPNGNVTISGKNVTIAANNKVNIMSGTDMKNRFVPDAYFSQNKLKNFGISSLKTVMDVCADTISGEVHNILTKMVDFSLIRTVLEIALRPIDGTTKIKSFTFVQVEAGKGSVEFPADAISKNFTREHYYPKLKHSIDAIVESLDAGDVNTCYENLCGCIKLYKYFLVYYGCEDIISFDKIRENGKEDKYEALKDSDFKWSNYHLNAIEVDAEIIKQEKIKKLEIQAEPKETDACYQPDANPRRDFDRDKKTWNDCMESVISEYFGQYDRESDKKVTRDNIKSAAENVSSAFHDYKVAIDKFNKLNCEKYKRGINKRGIDILRNGIIVYEKEIVDALNSLETEVNDILKYDSITIDTEYQQLLDPTTCKTYRRKAVHLFLQKVSKKFGILRDKTFKLMEPKAVNDYKDDTVWQKCVDDCVSIETEPTPSKNPFIFEGQKIVNLEKKWFEDNLKDPWRDMTVNRRRWRTGVEGKILMSDSPTTTISFGQNGDSNAEWNVVASEKYVQELKNYLKKL